jgi:large subunit ribosomal protein L21
MYAIVETGGKQYRATEAELLRVEKLPAEVGEAVTLPHVLLLSSEDGVRVGAPYVPGASVTARVVRHGKGRKIEGFTYKPKKNQRRRFGHRQQFTELRVEAISA